MEFPDLGKHCAEPTCKQLDFLPFVCDACKKVFCLEHRDYTSHKCSEVVSVEIPQCPICGQLVSIRKGEDPNRMIDEHISKGCPKEETSRRSNPCSYPRCKTSELVPVLCPNCHKNFCLSHRLPQDHNCVTLQSNSSDKSTLSVLYETKEKIQKRINELVTKYNQTKPTAKKVSLMKMKSQAKGAQSIPEDKRFYLEVVYPISSSVQPKYVYVSSAWTVGKEVGNIENKNNQSNAEKLRLYSLKNGAPLEMSLKLTDCAEVLQSGDSVLLEYETQVPNQ